MSTYDWFVDFSKNEELCKGSKVGRDFLKSAQYYSSGIQDIKSMLAKTVAVAVMDYGAKEISRVYEKLILNAIDSLRGIEGYDFNFVVKFFKAYIGDLSDVLLEDLPKSISDKNLGSFTVVQDAVSKLPMLFITVGSVEDGLYDWEYTMGVLSRRLIKSDKECACMYNKSGQYTLGIFDARILISDIENKNLNGYLNGYYRQLNPDNLFTDLVPVSKGLIDIKTYNKLSDNSLSAIDSILFTNSYSPVVVAKYLKDKNGTEYLQFREGICKFDRSKCIAGIANPLVLRKVKSKGKEIGIVIHLKNSTDGLKMVTARTSLNAILDVYDKKELKWGSDLNIDLDLESLTSSNKEYMLVKEEDFARTVLKVDKCCAGESSIDKKQFFISQKAINKYDSDLFKKWYFITGIDMTRCKVVIDDNIICYSKSLKALMGTLEVVDRVGVDKFKNNAQFSALLGLPKWNLKFMLNGKLFDYKSEEYREVTGKSKPRYLVNTSKNSIYKYILQETEV